MLFSEANQFSQEVVLQNVTKLHLLKISRFLSIFVRLSMGIYEIMYKINSNFPKKLRSKDSFLNRFVYVVQASKYNVYYVSKVVVPQGQIKQVP